MTETYAFLIELGVKNGYSVIPEFPIPTGTEGNNKVDLVFAKKKNLISNEADKFNLNAWEVHYAIEIDGVDVKRGGNNSTFRKHAVNYEYFSRKQAPGIFKKGINVLYYNAYHRTKQGGWTKRINANWERKWEENEQAYLKIARDRKVRMEIYLGWPQPSEVHRDDTILGLKI